MDAKEDILWIGDNAVCRRAEARLAILASKAGRTKDSCLREIIERGLEDAEDYYLAAEVLKGVREGRCGCILQPKVRRHLGLED